MFLRLHHFSFHIILTVIGSFLFPIDLPFLAQTLCCFPWVLRWTLSSVSAFSWPASSWSLLLLLSNLLSNWNNVSMAVKLTSCKDSNDRKKSRWRLKSYVLFIEEQSYKNCFFVNNVWILVIVCLHVVWSNWNNRQLNIEEGKKIWPSKKSVIKYTLHM